MLAGALALTSCSGTVAVDEPTPAGADRAVCVRLMAGLPARVHDQARRTVRPGAFAAAWGKPAITLRCGVPKPPALTDASECFGVNKVGWFAEQTSAGYRFTTIGRQTYVEVGVPAHYTPEADALVDVAAVITASDRLIKPCV